MSVGLYSQGACRIILQIAKSRFSQPTGRHSKALINTWTATTGTRTVDEILKIHGSASVNSKGLTLLGTICSDISRRLLVCVTLWLFLLSNYWCHEWPVLGRTWQSDMQGIIIIWSTGMQCNREADHEQGCKPPCPLKLLFPWSACLYLVRFTDLRLRENYIL